jgi:protein gp37
MRRQRVFCLSLGDWLDEEVPIEWLSDLLQLIHATQNLDWQLLTKRPEHWKGRIEKASDWNFDHGDRNLCGRLWDWLKHDVAPPNIWIGVSAGADQKAALEIPAKVHFLSCEPMLHALDTTHAAGFDWIIFGGESGKNARPCDVSWIRKGVEFCKARNVASFVKQLGARPFENHEPVDPTPLEEINFHRNGWCKISFADGGGRGPVWNKNYRLSDSHGGDMTEWPEDLRVREFPTAREAVSA